jgi:hypothetical protein
MANDDYVAFVLTHGRPYLQHTLAALHRQGYTGPWYLVVDDEDASLPDYERLYRDRVLIFNKAEIARTFDEAGRFKDRRAVVYARNACFGLARQLGYVYFIELDDDYPHFAWRFDHNRRFVDKQVRNLDRIFDTMFEFYRASGALAVAIAQGGDFIGGAAGNTANRIWLKRKAMNVLFLSTDRPFSFLGRVNEDVNAYVRYGNVGHLFFTSFNVAIKQQATQAQAGGMTDLYLSSGTYVKSFYTVMFAPSCASVSRRFQRIHHTISWRHCVPHILPERVRKPLHEDQDHDATA